MIFIFPRMPFIVQCYTIKNSIISIYLDQNRTFGLNNSLRANDLNKTPKSEDWMMTLFQYFLKSRFCMVRE